MRVFLSEIETTVGSTKPKKFTPMDPDRSDDMIDAATGALYQVQYGATIHINDGNSTSYLTFGYKGGRRSEPPEGGYTEGLHEIRVDTGWEVATVTFSLFSIGGFRYMELVLDETLMAMSSGEYPGHWFGHIKIVQPDGSTICEMDFDDPNHIDSVSRRFDGEFWKTLQTELAT